jgi:hypothetical protein
MTPPVAEGRDLRFLFGLAALDRLEESLAISIAAARAPSRGGKSSHVTDTESFTGLDGL